MPTATEPQKGPSGSRRAFIGQAIAAGLACTGKIAGAAPTHQEAPHVLTTWMQGAQSWAGIWTPGRLQRAIALPARAHQLLLIPNSQRRGPPQALVLARRPGEYLARIDVLRGKALQWRSMEEDRYLAGHAALCANGRTFFTTETDAASGHGMIAERCMNTLGRLREFPSGGIGPHALLLDGAGGLLVANGGILNLPETGRRKRNSGTMAPNLTRLSAVTGGITAQYRLNDPFLSLRHMAQAPDGTVAVALQAEHASPELRRTAPALALLKGDQFHALLWDDVMPIPPRWDGYTADVCFAQGQFWVSAPHAGWLGAWSSCGQGQTSHALAGAGALAARDEYWVVSGSATAVLYGGENSPTRSYSLANPWDNHALLL